MIDIMPLMPNVVDEAIAVLDKEFGPEGPDPCDPKDFDAYQTWLPATVNGNIGLLLMDKHNIHDLKYWVAVNAATNKVVGVTGVFTEPFAPNIAWLGWTTALPGMPLGVEGALISFAADMGRSLGKRFLAVYAPEGTGEDDAFIIRMRSRHGFLKAEPLRKPGEDKQVDSYNIDLRLSVLGERER